MSPRTKNTSTKHPWELTQSPLASIMKSARTRKARNRVRRSRRNLVETLESRQMLAVAMEFVPDTGTITVENDTTIVTVAPSTNITFEWILTMDEDLFLSQYQLNLSASSTELAFHSWAEDPDVFFAFANDDDLSRDPQGNVLVSGSNDRERFFVPMTAGVPDTIASFGVLAPATTGTYDLIAGPNAGFLRTVVFEDFSPPTGPEEILPVTDYGNLQIRVQIPGQPTGVADSATVDEDSSDNVIAVLANDTDPELDPLSITGVADFSDGGSATFNGGTIQYTPAPDFAGTETFTYTMTDGNTPEVVVAVEVMVTNINDDPVTVPDNISLDEDSSHTFDADLETTSNDTDADGDVLSLTDLTGVANGMLTDLGFGLFTYTPNENFFGTESLTYTVTDGNGGTATGTLTITVDPINDDPLTDDDGPFSTDEDVALTLTIADLLLNDTDIDGDTLRLIDVTDGGIGTVVDNNDGTLTYTPNPNANGSDIFSYTVTDDAGGTNTAEVTIDVDPVNDPPTAVADDLSVNEDTDLTIDIDTDLLGNDSDLDGDAFSFTGFTPVGTGSLTNNGDGTLLYSPPQDFHGTTTFTYTIADGGLATSTNTVTITVNPINDPPVAVADPDQFSGDEDTSITITSAGLLADDTDIDGDTLLVLSIADPNSGSITDNLDGTFTYEPNENFNGTDTFNYTITDQNGATATASLTVTVNSVNDPPVAIGDSLFVAEDNDLPISVEDDILDNDSDVDGNELIFAITQTTVNGTLTDNNDGTLSYSPNENYNGTDSFTYAISDGAATVTATVTITVTPVNDPPVAVDDADTTDEDVALSITIADLLANDSDVDGDDVSFVSNTDPTDGTLVNNGDGTLTYTPNENVNGSDSFTYTISDGNLGRATATVNLTINSVNDPPEAMDDTGELDEDTTLQISANSLVQNDTDSDGGTIAFDGIATQPSNGSLTDGGDGSFTYTPNTDFNGTDTFTYTVTDSQGATDVGTVTITVNPINDPPIAADDPDRTVDEDTALSLTDLLDNDSDIDGDTVTILSTDDGGNGTATLEGDGSITYQPNEDYTGSDSFTYTLTDNVGGTSTATVFIEVLPVNDPPEAINDAPEVDENSADNFLDLLANDSVGPDGNESITIIAVGDTNAGGTVTLLGDGSGVTYTPARRFFGQENFSYTISDGNGGTSIGDVTVTVIDLPNELPEANDDTATVDEDSSNNVIDVLGNDSDLDGDTLTITALGTPDAGGFVVTVNNNTEVEYTPLANYSGTESFSYTISDGNGGTEMATVTVTVTEINDPPVANADDYALNQGDSLNITAAGGVLSNDTDVEDNPITATLVDDVTHGTLTLNEDGSFEYTPNFFFWGTDSFTYTASDGDVSNTATVTLDVAVGTPWRNPVNPFDINDDGAFEPLDILVIINKINKDGAIEGLPVPNAGFMPPPFFDPNGDNNMFPDDVLMLVNAFNRGDTQLQGEGIVELIAPSSSDSSNGGDEDRDGSVILGDDDNDSLFSEQTQRTKIVDALFTDHARSDGEAEDLLGFDLNNIL